MTTSLIGSCLKSAREQRELTLEDAAHETRIPLQRLEWLEEDNYAAFGSLTYARAFLKIYSAYLDVDATELLGEMPSTRLRAAPSFRSRKEKHGEWAPGTFSRHTPAKAVPQKGVPAPVTGGIAIFILILLGTVVWAHHISQQQIGGRAGHATSFASQIAVTPKTEIISAQPDSLYPLEAATRKRVMTKTSPTFEAGIPAGMD